MKCPTCGKSAAVISKCSNCGDIRCTLSGCKRPGEIKQPSIGFPGNNCLICKKGKFVKIS